MTAPQVTWKTGRSSYTYEGYPVNSTTWNPVAGNYVFAKQTATGWTALYAGKTENFKSRFENHEKLPLAIKNGATHIFARTNSDAVSRTNEETDFVGYFKPPLNEQLK